MNIKEKAAYVKGLLSGLDLDDDKKETKLFKAMVDLMEDISLSVEDLEEDVDDICDQLDILDEDLAEIEDEIYGDECECECECECDGECDCGDRSGENFYEVVCPSCEEKICLSEETLLDDEMDCPRCGELLEFDLSDIEDSGCGCKPYCECDCECECESDCECDCHCSDDK